MPDTLAPYLDRLLADIDEARQQADFVLFCPHIGGQFNPIPGAFSKYIVSAAAERGVDAIAASHAHVVQEAEMRQGIPCFYSLGNFSMSPNSVYLLHEDLPEYGIAAHLYLENARIAKTSFSILRIVEEKSMTVFPVDVFAKRCAAEEAAQLSEAVRRIVRTVTGKDAAGELFQKEYVLA